MSKLTLSLTTLSLLLVSVASFAQAEQSVSYTYNELGLIASVDGPRVDVDDITTFTYDASGNRSTITNALGHVSQITAYDLSGRPLSIVDANGTTTLLTYDVRGRLLSQETASRLTSFSYDLTGNVTEISQGDDQVLTYHYDSAHRPTGYSDALGNTVTFVLDAAGNTLEQTITDPNGNLTQRHRYIVDELSRLRRDIGAQDQTATLDYDLNNNLTEQRDPNGNPTHYAFDGLNRLVDTTDADNGHTLYHYDESNKLTSLTDPNGYTTHYRYDAFDNLIEQTSPDTGITRFSYDKANNRLSKTDARDYLTTYQYDTLNRLTHINYADTRLNVIYDYDNNANAQYGIGRLTSQVDNSGTTFYSYDVYGNLISQTLQTAKQSHLINYAYTDSDKLAQLTYPDDSHVDYRYDSAGNLIDLHYTNSLGVNQRVLNDLTYQPFGPMTSQTFGNGLTTQQVNDLDYRQVQLATPNTVERNYDFDLNSNITNITDLLNTTNSQYFNYDQQNRLELAGSDHYGEINYFYDAAHNRTSQYTLINTLSLENDYDYALDSNQLLRKTADSVTHYAYDENGNMTNNGTYQFRYGQDNRLQSVSMHGQTIARYHYNAQGQRSSKTVDNKTIHYLYNQSGQLLTEISQGHDKQLTPLQDQSEALQSSLTNLQSEYQKRDNEQQQLHIQSEVNQAQRSSEQRILTTLLRLEKKHLRRINHSKRMIAKITQWQQRFSNTIWSDLLARWKTRHQQREQVQQVQLEETHVLITRQEDMIAELDNAININQTLIAGIATQLLTLQQQQQEQQRELDDIKQQLVELEQNSEPVQTHYKHYIYANGSLTAIVEDEHIYYVHNDHLGTPQTITDTNQDIVWQAHYTPFGEATISINTLENNIRFPGQYYDSETQLHYNYFRYYDPTLGRYITSDPIGLAGGINTYAYVLNNPVNYIDIFGLVRWPESGATNTVGREGTIVPPGGTISSIIQDNIAYGWQFGYEHDNFVDKYGQCLPDLIVNIPSMPPVYIYTLIKERAALPLGDRPTNFPILEIRW